MCVQKPSLTGTCRVLLVAGLVWTAPVASSAAIQTRDIFVSPTTGVGVGSVWGVFIGVSQYQNTELNLKYADRDAQALHDFFATQFQERIPADQFKLLTNKEASRGKILRALGEVLRRAQPEDLVILSLAMHGLLDASGEDLYFLTHEADPNFPEDEGISRHDLLRQISRSKARKIVLFLDACHTGAFSSFSPLLAMRAANATDVNRLLNAMGRAQAGMAVLSSSSAAERSQEGEKFCGGHGAFTCGLLTGLRGEADTNRNGLVELRELYDYTYRAVKTSTDGYQNPAIEGRYDNGLPLAYALGGEGVPTSPPAQVGEGGASSKEMARLRTEFEVLKQQMSQSRVEEQSRLKAEQKRLKAERLEAKRVRVEQERQLAEQRARFETERQEAERLRAERERKLAEEQARLEVEREVFREQTEERAKLRAQQPEPPQVAYAPPLRPALERRVFKVSLEECLANYDDTHFLAESKAFCKVEKRKAKPGEKKVEGTSESFHYYNMLGTIDVEIVANVNGYTITYWEKQPGEDAYLDHEDYIGQAIDELKDQEVMVVVTGGE